MASKTFFYEAQTRAASVLLFISPGPLRPGFLHPVVYSRVTACLRVGVEMFHFTSCAGAA